MPVLTYDDGRVHASRAITCRQCSARLTLALETEGRPETSAREHILITLEHVLVEAALKTSWTNIDRLLRGDCPRHKVG